MADDTATGAYFLPHPAYAEDQPYARAILTTHVFYRAFQTGSLLGAVAGAGRHLVRRAASPGFSASVLRGAGRGSLIASAVLAVGLPVRMAGRTDIEWRDRAWRLLENEGQISTDRWSGVGTLAGAGLYAVAGPAAVAGALPALGAMGIGSLVGCVGSMGYRYQTAVGSSGKS